MNARPLYETSLPPAMTRPSGAHAGLWYDKFGPWCLDSNNEWGSPKFEKLAWIKGTATLVGDAPLLREHAERRQAMISQLRGRALHLKTASRFVTGLGYRHAVENGFAWHHTLGTPYLPGSGLKGVARTWATLWAQRNEEEEDIKRIFGPRGEKVAHEVGSVIFLEAIPRAPVQLVAEVMTPHYGPYHQGEGSVVAPGDYHDPNPVPFLAVDTGAAFLAGVLPRGEGARAEKDVEIAHRWLREALVEIGAGAKTATGHGRFERDPEGERAWEALAGRRAEETKQRELERRLREGGPLERMRLLVAGLSEAKLYAKAQAWIVKGELTDPGEREAFCRAAQETPCFVLWKKGQAKEPKSPPAGKDKLKEMARLLGEVPAA